MPTPKPQAVRALSVIKSATVPIPKPFPLASGSTTATQANVLISTGAGFYDKNVRPGDVVYNTTTGASALVTSNIAGAFPSRVGLSADIFTAIAQSFVIYAGPYSGIEYGDCVLYIGTGGSLEVETVGGDIVIFFNIPNGYILPVNVRRVGTVGTATNILALW